MTEYFENSNLCTIHTRQIMIMPKDMQLIRRIKRMDESDHIMPPDAIANNQNSKRPPAGVYNKKLFKRAP